MTKIAVTLGEPAGIGPDIGVMLAEKGFLDKNIVVITDPDLILSSASRLKKNIKVNILKNIESKTYSSKNKINILPIKLITKNIPGEMNPRNAPFVISAIKKAANLCLNKKCSAMVTGPISKAVLNDAGYSISGHTEFLAKMCKTKSVMMLMNRKMKIALHTTHIPLNNVSKYITKHSLKKTIQIIHKDLKDKFHIKNPSILVTGLNPHAGESGYLGNEEKDIIMPLIKKLKADNLKIDGPCPADTAFLKKNIQKYDVILTMYHDQGLPVIKFNDFKKTVNITLGLPITRVSVDHGVALELVGSNKIDISSFAEALKVAKKYSK